MRSQPHASAKREKDMQADEQNRPSGREIIDMADRRAKPSEAIIAAIAV